MYILIISFFDIQIMKDIFHNTAPISMYIKCLQNIMNYR